ncbi:MAG: hypothetical protein U1E87_06200 [Alphaproteobacteria bacterium]
MKLAVPKELEGEPRVAATPDTVKKFIGLGAEVIVQSGAGNASGIFDQMFANAGARIAASLGETVAGSDIVLKVRGPAREEIGALGRGTAVAAMLNPYGSKDLIAEYANAGLTAFAMEFMPRITRAQSMDGLSAQSIQDEIAILQARRPRDLVQYEEEKARLGKIYASEIARLRKAFLIKGLPRETLDTLKRSTTRFRELTQRQQNMLQAMRTVSERMIKDVASEFQRLKAPETPYGRNAAYAGRSASPFALNRTA